MFTLILPTPFRLRLIRYFLNFKARPDESPFPLNMPEVKKKGALTSRRLLEA